MPNSYPINQLQQVPDLLAEICEQYDIQISDDYEIALVLKNDGFVWLRVAVKFDSTVNELPLADWAYDSTAFGWAFVHIDRESIAHIILRFVDRHRIRVQPSASHRN